MADKLAFGIFWIGCIVIGAMIGRDKGRVVEGIALTAVLGVVGVMLVVVLPPKPVTSRIRYQGAIPPSTPKIDQPRGYVTCGCAILCAIGMVLLWSGLGFGGAGNVMFTDVLFFGSIFSVPAAVCTYSGLTYFGASGNHAKIAALIVFALMFGATWLFLMDLEATHRQLRADRSFVRISLI